MRFELVVPAYNEARSLERLVRRYEADAAHAGLAPGQFKLVIVDNGSTDDTRSVLSQLLSSPLSAWFRVVTVEKNAGYGNGLRAGLATTTAPVIGISHADEQCAPEDVFVAYEKASTSPTEVLVKGCRSGRNWKDVFVSRVFDALATLILGLRASEINAQPKVFPRSLLLELKNPPPHFAFDLYVLYHARKQGLAVTAIPVVFPPRVHGASKWAATFVSRYRTILGQIGYMFRLLAMEGRC